LPDWLDWAAGIAVVLIAGLVWRQLSTADDSSFRGSSIGVAVGEHKTSPPDSPLVPLAIIFIPALFSTILMLALLLVSA